MGLENLKSVFQEELINNIESFSSNVITNVNDTKLTQFTTPELGKLIGQSPLEGKSWETLYNPNHSPKDDVGYNYPNASRGNLNIRNSEDGRFGFGGSTRTSAISAVGKLIGTVPFLEGNITEFLKDTGKEPYIVSPIPKTQSDLFSGRTINFGSRDLPIARSITDTVRLAKFLTSPAGLIFIEKQKVLVGDFPSPLNNLGIKDFQGQKYKKGYNPISTLMSTLGRAGGGPVGLVDRTEPSLSGLLSFLDVGVELDSYPEFNLFDEIASPMKNRGDDLTDDFFGSSTDNLITTDRSPKNENIEEVQPGGLQSLNNTFTGDGNPAGGKSYPESDGTKPVGDRMTLASIIEGNSLDNLGGQTTGLNDEDNKLTFNVEDVNQGMPFYFKDLRDNKYIFFRAFIEGLTENISPSYNSTQYIGRSEPVYTYSMSERELSLTLKLFAQTKDELGAIYTKMNKLTSLCYPEYFKDEVTTEVDDGTTTSNVVTNVGYGNRMKAPLTKLRIGEMFGNTNSELQGYIKSLSYSVDQASPYETEVGKRVPKFVTATIGYQVIHSTVPNLETKFYGYIGD
jgi:hypothetical protein